MFIRKIEKSELNISNLLKLFNYNKKIIILFVFFVSIITVIYSFIIPRTFSSTTSILPPDESSVSNTGLSSLIQNVSGGMPLSGNSMTGKASIYKYILKSRENVDYIINKLELKKLPQFKKFDDLDLNFIISSSINVDADRNGMMFVTTFLNTPYFSNMMQDQETAKLASDIANISIEGLDVLNRKLNNSKAVRKLEFISKVLDEKNAALDSLDITLEKFMNVNKVLSIDKQTSATIGNAVEVGSELARAEIDLKLKQQEYENNSPIITALQQKISSLRQQYMDIQSGGLVNNDKYSLPLNNVANLARQYQILIRDQKILEQLKLYLETQKYQEAIQAESDVPTIEVLDKAIPLKTRVSPSRSVMLTTSIIISTIFILAFVTVIALRKGYLFLLSNETAINKE